jgi:hypothetical protein
MQAKGRSDTVNTRAELVQTVQWLDDHIQRTCIATGAVDSKIGTNDDWQSTR